MCEFRTIQVNAIRNASETHAFQRERKTLTSFGCGQTKEMPLTDQTRSTLTLVWTSQTLQFVNCWNCFLFLFRYKEDISSEQKEALLEVLRVHVHDGITPEIRRELVNSKCRDEETAQPKDMDF